MPPRRKAADYFTQEEQNASGVVEQSKAGESTDDDGKRLSLRRSSRLHSTPSAEPDARTKTTTKQSGRQGVTLHPYIVVRVPATQTSRPEGNTATRPPAEENFVAAREHPDGLDQLDSQRSDATKFKSPDTEDQYVSAVEDISRSPTLSGDTSGLNATPRPSHTQNTLDNIPSSQPRPRSQRSPVPLQPVSSSPPAASFPISTPASQTKSTTTSTEPPIPLALSSAADGSDDSDDDAPEPISLSQSRSQVLASQSKITQQNRLQAEKARAKRRRRDVLLVSQKQSKKRPAEAIEEATEEEQELEEIPDSQQSLDAESGNTTDTPAPNQAHQAARLARHADALPADILHAAGTSWFEETVWENRGDAVVKKRKQKAVEDDGMRVLEEMNFGIAPKAGRIGLIKEQMIMRMGKGQRRMFVGRFARS